MTGRKETPAQPVPWRLPLCDRIVLPVPRTCGFELLAVLEPEVLAQEGKRLKISTHALAVRRVEGVLEVDGVIA